MLFRLGELFAGAGGLAYGASIADAGIPGVGIQHAWATDCNKDACETYRLNICPDAPETVICTDVRTLDLRSLPPIDAFAYGFPCNDFSSIGTQSGLSGEYGSLYLYGIDVLKLFRPQWFFAENVPHLRSMDKGKIYDRILGDMRNAGYKLYPNIYKFETYGVPQMRHRLVIVGIRDDLPFEFKIPSTAPYAMEDVSIKTALESPPIPADAPNQECWPVSQTVVERLSYVLPGQTSTGTNVPENLRLHRKFKHRRQCPEKPSHTVTADSAGNDCRECHWSEPRRYTNRELARIQTFPDSYKFVGSRTSVHGQIGMAVPPGGAKVIFEAILKTFSGIPYESMPANL